MERSSRDSNLNERIHKLELNSQRALDEIFGYNEQIRQLQEERKRDIQETADFIKEVMENNKQEFNRDMQNLRTDLDKARNDIVDRCSMQEVLGIKQALMVSLDTKVDVEPVGAVFDSRPIVTHELPPFLTVKAKSNGIFSLRFHKR